MPSLRLKIAVVGTGGVSCSGLPSAWVSSALRPLAYSYSRHALVARGLPLNGLPSVMTSRTSSGRCLAS